MLYKVSLFFIFLFFYFIGYSQQRDTIFEQTALNFFVDSIATENYKTAKLLYYKPKINQQATLLRQPLGFKDYKSKKDSTEVQMLRKELESIKQLNLSGYSLEAKQAGGLKVLQYPENVNRIKWNKSVRIEVFKRTIVKPDYYVVEIVAFSKDLRSHFFVEMSQAENSVTRWYKSSYIY